MAKLRILIASRSRVATDHLNRCLADHREFLVNSRILSNGHADPLYGIDEVPDLLLLHHDTGGLELRYLAEHGQRGRVPLIVCGPDDDPDGMRLAMQAGARDYLPASAPESDLISSLTRLLEENSYSGTSGSGKLIVVMNGKGGSGASFLATNLAHGLVVDAQKQVTLIDLDLQFGGLSRYLDISADIGLLQALEAAKQMDDVSAEAYTSVHSSGLRLLAAPSTRLTQPNDVSTEELDALLKIFLSNNEYLVVDSPNRLDSVTEFVLERADKIVLVVQQSLPHIQDTARMLQIMTGELAIPKNRIGVVVNRFTKNSLIELRDIRKALRQDDLITIPNQYKLATESISTGIPVAEISKSAPLTKGIRELQAVFEAQGSEPAQNFLARALPSILRS